MKKINIAAALVLSLALGSCSRVLDVKPQSDWAVENFYSSDKEVMMALSGIYNQLMHNDCYGYGFNVVLESGTDEMYTNNTGSSTIYDAARYMYLPSDNLIKGSWTQFYACINLVNQLERNLDPTAFDTDIYNNYLARARFYRGFCYLQLANAWGAVPIRLTPTRSQEDNNVPASPVLEVYQQAEKDLLFAAQHLYHAKDPDYLPGEPNSMAAHGLLARLYLRMGGYQPYLAASDSECYFPDNEQYFEKALAQCDTVIYQDGWHNIVPYATDPISYKNQFMNYIQDRYDPQESMFEISFGYLSGMGISVHGRMGNQNGVYFSSGATASYPRGFAQVNASIVLYDLYQLNPEDTRMEWNIAGYRNDYSSTTDVNTINYIFDSPLNSKYGIGKYRRWEPTDWTTLKSAKKLEGTKYVILNTASATDANFTSINFPVLRFSDVLLMYAEAAIGGKEGTASASQRALDCLNKVRNRAGLADFTATDHEAFFNELVDERMRELCFEGLRKTDLIRWNLLQEKLAYTATSIKNNAAYSETNTTHATFLMASEYFNKAKHMTLPYPQQEVEINKYLEQKTNWR